MIGFWSSDGVLIATQASLVCGPRPSPPRVVLRLRSGAWAWSLPVSLGGTVLLLALVPAAATFYAVTALVAVPVLASLSLASLLGSTPAWSARGRLPRSAAAALLALSALLVAWVGYGSLLGDAAGVLLTSLSACAVASYVAALTSTRLLRVGTFAMAALDAVLVFGNLLEGPNHTLNAASVGEHLPHLQVATFGAALIGYGDLFLAAILGSVLARGTGWEDLVEARGVRIAGAVLLLVISTVFDLLFLVVDELPATVPVALTLLLIGWRRGRRGNRQGPRPAVLLG